MGCSRVYSCPKGEITSEETLPGCMINQITTTIDRFPLLLYASINNSSFVSRHLILRTLYAHNWIAKAFQWIDLDRFQLSSNNARLPSYLLLSLGWGSLKPRPNGNALHNRKGQEVSFDCYIQRMSGRTHYKQRLSETRTCLNPSYRNLGRDTQICVAKRWCFQFGCRDNGGSNGFAGFTCEHFRQVNTR